MRGWRTWLLVAALSGLAIAHQDDATFLTAMKSLIWGPHENGTQMDPAKFHQYSSAARSSSSSSAGSSVSGSACTLPQQIGTGPYRIPRWYYNPARQRCELFYWSGCCGNQNNFQTFQNCQQVCEVTKQTLEDVRWMPSYSQIVDITVTIPSSSCGCARALGTQWPVPGAGMSQTTGQMGCACCLQPYSEGHGTQNLQRFYFELGESRCKPFVYRGQGGQGNIFDTEIQCSKACQAFGPQAQGQYVPQQPEQPIVMPRVTLPPMELQPVKKVDPCEQEPESGVGALQLSRWVFNKKTKLCEPFVYFGSGGNRNNFETLVECQQQCPESPNPCAVQTTGPLVQCMGGSSCGSGYYCHSGAVQNTNVCCPRPSSLDRCQQPLNIGIGNENLQRWYFNPLTQQCQTCVYKGLQGNENNFASKNDCENACQVNPCRVGSPFRSQGITVQCSAMNPTVCPAGYYCHIGADQSTSLCCQALGTNPCTEPMLKGEGTGSLTRFFYDSMQRKCLTFNYLGTKGNMNNFMTRELCENACPVWSNPCAVGIPIMGADQRPMKCSNVSPCPTTHFCHLGFDEATTVCCPAQGDPCVVPMTEGTGNQAIHRWFYNDNTRQCQPFTYRGSAGNENNFLLREHCEATCPVWLNPCPQGEPILSADNRPLSCEPDVEGACPSSHWCHPGSDPSTSYCCPGNSDPCLLAKTEGDGPLALTRYYFDASRRQCLEFSYRGLRGNANNFMTEGACASRCPVQVDPCPITFSSLAHVVTLTKCSGTYSCPDQQWCHIGATDETTVCCPNAVADPCKAAPRNPGTGDYKTTRWAFDSTGRKCVPFEYRGMKGNANNFISRESCETKCPVFVNPCKVGEPFQSGGRYQVCNPESQCPAKHYCHIGESSNYCCPMLGGDPCGQPMDRGTGGAQLQRWYWNVNQQCCLPFSYCGQKGTQNNFLSRTDCERTCYELDNPCAGGDPLLGPNNRPLTCPAPDSPTCGNAHWCHIGGSQQTTVCCPQRVDGEEICNLPLVEGDGDYSLDRFYFDVQTRQCIPFVYKGRLGNQNNFLTQEACENLCPVFVNVCPVGQPLLDTSNRPIPCTFGSDSCGDHHWCHLGLVPDEYQCCPGTPPNPGACQGGPFVIGNVSDRAPPALRWYYDKDEMACLTSTYNGRQGSQNNFLTKEDCEATCDVFESPCALPLPTLPATMCQSDNMCGSSMYCHIGLTQDTSVCCPAEGDPCSLPLSQGQGNGNAQRWYYDPSSYTCQPFQYRGTKGNQNNFLSRDACEERCGPNPCFEGRPFQGVDGKTQTCTASASINTCPASYWCHVGADMSLTVCCPGASTNVCNLPMSTGEGNYNLDRYYYDSQARTCRPFKYNGLKGNQNNFLTLRACQLSCQPLDNPCIGQPAVTAAGQVIFCSATNKDACPVNFWCHIGATPETTVCCPGATNACSVPLAPGTGISGLPRYYYNPDDRQCEPFTYNGKRGNQNNFLSQAECERTCPVFADPCEGQALRKSDDGPPQFCDPMLPPHSPSCPRAYFCLPGDPEVNRSSVCCPSKYADPCEAPLNEGEGQQSLARFYYSSSEGGCFPFAYRGQRGNENNFLSRQICEEHCAPVGNVCFGGEPPLIQDGRIIQCVSSCPIGYYCHRGANPKTTVCCKSQGHSCDEQLMRGAGEATLPRFFYDHVADDCVPFNYTGIGGNENNFMTKSQCQIACPGLRGYCPHGRPHASPLGSASPLERSNHVVTSCGVDISCPAAHICHVTRRTGKSVCCPDPASFCIQPLEPGRCFQNTTRYAYDRHTGTCTKFSYTGCGGNLNNFGSLESCTEICCDKGYKDALAPFYRLSTNSGIFTPLKIASAESDCPEELCLLSIDRGACSNRVSRYAFDRQTNQCIAFEYTGCGGNLNNFASYEDCEATCAKVRFRR